MPQIKGLDGVVLSLWIVESDSQLQQPPSSTPACRFINLKGVPGSNLVTLDLLEATLLLENPVGENLLTLDQLEREVRVCVGRRVLAVVEGEGVSSSGGGGCKQ